MKFTNIIILTLPLGVGVTEFEKYIPHLLGGSVTNHILDEQFFSCLARFLSDNDPTHPHRIVSIHDESSMLPLPPHSVLRCIIHGHGVSDGAIGVVAPLIEPEDFAASFESFLVRNPLVASSRQVLIDSCFADPSIVSDVCEVLAVAPSRRSLSILGCTGISILHPDPAWPIVQIQGWYEIQGVTLQRWLEYLHSTEIENGVQKVQQLLPPLLTLSSTDKAGRLELLKITALSIGDMQKPIFNEYISLLYALGYLSLICFTCDSDGLYSQRKLPKAPSLSDDLKHLKDMLQASQAMTSANEGEIRRLIEAILPTIYFPLSPLLVAARSSVPESQPSGSVTSVAS